MKTLLSSIIFFLLCSTAYAESYGKYGIGISNSAKYSKGEVKTLALGYNERLFTESELRFLRYQFEGGGWADTIGNGRKSSGYGSVQLGLRVDGGPFTMYSYHGLGAITNKDIYLGSNAQVFNDFGFGIKDDHTKSSITINYKHISNGGALPGPNKGRDFIMIKLEIPW